MCTGDQATWPSAAFILFFSSFASFWADKFKRIPYL
jgi:hypothetical protein